MAVHWKHFEYKAAREGDEIDRGRVDEMERLRYKSVDEADVAEAIQDGNTECGARTTSEAVGAEGGGNMVWSGHGEGEVQCSKCLEYAQQAASMQIVVARAQVVLAPLCLSVCLSVCLSFCPPVWRSVPLSPPLPLQPTLFSFSFRFSKRDSSSIVNPEKGGASARR